MLPRCYPNTYCGEKYFPAIEHCDLTHSRVVEVPKAKKPRQNDFAELQGRGIPTYPDNPRESVLDRFSFSGPFNCVDQVSTNPNQFHRHASRLVLEVLAPSKLGDLTQELDVNDRYLLLATITNAQNSIEAKDTMIKAKDTMMDTMIEAKDTMTDTMIEAKDTVIEEKQRVIEEKERVIQKAEARAFLSSTSPCHGVPSTPAPGVIMHIEHHSWPDVSDPVNRVTPKPAFRCWWCASRFLVH
jgi:hypothetical protein